ncbi:hypothetical protein [Lentzea sp.]|uniref:hypothetical protein n=1 Tax=Lentzea sp. TaxID=56099 RepID=UPI002ED68FE4
MTDEDPGLEPENEPSAPEPPPEQEPELVPEPADSPEEPEPGQAWKPDDELPQPDAHREARPSGEWAHRTAEFQRQRSEGMRAFGYDVPGRTVIGSVRSHGPTLMGSNSEQNNFSYYFSNQRVTARAGRLTTYTTTTTYAPFPWYTAARDLLKASGLVYLCGLLGSGRLSTAITLGAELCAQDRVIMVDLDEGVDLATLVDEDRRSVLLPGHAHVIELEQKRPVRQSTLASLAGWAMDNDACVIVIGPSMAKADHSLHPYAMVHEPPDPRSVLIRHLQHGLTSVQGAPPGFIDECLMDEEISAHLDKSPLPHQVGELARRLIEGLDLGRRPAEALSLVGTQLRDVASRVLVRIEASGSLAETRKRHRELAARLAYAVFEDYSLTDVADAARLLYAALQTSHRSTRMSKIQPVFGQGVEDLLGEEMRVSGRSTVTTDEVRRAKLVDPSFAHHLLDVAWNDFDSATRPPLLLWLDALVNDNRKWIVLRAAMTAGYLATHDFSVLYQQLIRRWATAEGYRRRQAAAWALEFAAHNRQLTSRVTRQVADWALSSNHYMNDTAALAYATDIGTVSVENSLGGLRAVAMHPLLMKSSSVAYAITELYRPENANLLLNELKLWVDAGQQTLAHAARSIVFLSLNNSPDGVWPVLMQLMVSNEEASTRVRALWQVALTESLTGRRAWNTLLQWILRGDHEADLGTEVEKFVLDLLRRPDLVTRARFNVKLWRAQHPEADLLNRIADEL